MRIPGSLQGRLLALVAGMVAAVWIATAVTTWVDVRHELDELLDAHLAQAAALLVAQQLVGVEEDDIAIDAPTLHRYAPKVAFQVFHEGRLVMRSANAPAAPMVDPGESFGNGFRTTVIDGFDWRVFAARGAERDVQVYVGERADSRSAILRAVLRGTLWPLAFALPALLLALWWAVWRGTAPLRVLRGELQSRRPDALYPVAVEDAATEMRPMIDALNGLFARIGSLMEAERRFNADAAHELRTPIAAIRAQAQVALEEADDALRRHALRATIAGCDRAARLVEQMLTLARLEGGGVQQGGVAGAATSIDLPALARAAAGEVAQEAERKGQSIEVEAPSQAAGSRTVRGDAMLVAVLVRNLVDNAVRYSPQGARLRITVASDELGTHLVVADSGPGISEANLARLGDRFFRILGSDEAGSGLGWSIVRRIAAVQGVSVAARRSSDLGGLEVQVTWPSAK